MWVLKGQFTQKLMFCHHLLTLHVTPKCIFVHSWSSGFGMNEIAKIMDEVSGSVCDTCLKAVIIFCNLFIKASRIRQNYEKIENLVPPCMWIWIQLTITHKKLIGNLNWNEKKRNLLIVKKFNIGAYWSLTCLLGNAVFFHPGPQKLIY